MHSIVVADGNIEIKGGATRSLIVSRGNIAIRGSVDECVILSLNEVNLDPNRQHSQCVVKTGERFPLKFVTFFELFKVGVDAKPIDGVLTVIDTAAGKPFAAAGIKAGDKIVWVNAAKPDTAESLRQVLRDALAIGDAAVTVRRGDKTETVKISLPD